MFAPLSLQPLTDDDLLWKCIDDLYLPPLATGKFVMWDTHREIAQQSAFLRRIRSAEEFVAMVAKTKYLAFDVEKTISGTRCLRPTPLASRFYELLQTFQPGNFSYIPPHHEVGENTKALLNVFCCLGVADAHFTGYPDSIIGSGGLREDDFINCVIKRIREETGKASFKTRLKNRTAKAKQTASKLTRLIHRLRENNGHFYTHWLDFAYTSDAADSVKQADCATHFQELLNQLMQTPSVLGHFWIRDRLSKFGYRTRLAIFSRYLLGREIGSDANDIWQRITQNTGIVLPITSLPDNPFPTQELIQQMILSTTHFRWKSSSDCLGFSDLPARTSPPFPISVFAHSASKKVSLI